MIFQNRYGEDYYNHCGNCLYDLSSPHTEECVGRIYDEDKRIDCFIAFPIPLEELDDSR